MKSTATAPRAVAWAEWAGWICKEPEGFEQSGAQTLTNKNPRRETGGGFFVSGWTFLAKSDGYAEAAKYPHVLESTPLTRVANPRRNCCAPKSRRAVCGS